MLQPIMFQAGTPCLCFNRNGSICWRSSSPKEGTHLRCCPPKGHPCFPQPGPTAPDGQAAPQGMPGSRGEQRGGSCLSCLFHLCLRLGSAALCWYPTPAEPECAAKPRTQLRFPKGAVVCRKSQKFLAVATNCSFKLGSRVKFSCIPLSAQEN